MLKMFTVAAGVAALGMVAVAAAEDVKATDITVRAGVVFPWDSNLRQVSDLFFGAGVDYTFPNQIIKIKNSESYFSADWFGRSTNGRKGNVFPLALNQRFFSSGISNSLNKLGRTYFTIGLGGAVVDVGASQVKFLVRGGLGVELGPNIIAEAIATYTEKTRSGVRGSGVGVYFGYRF